MPITPAELKVFLKGEYTYRPYSINEQPGDSDFLMAVAADNASTANSPFSGIDTQQIKNLLPALNRSRGGIDREVVIGYFPPFEPSTSAFEEGFCGTDGDAVTLKQISFKFDGAVRTRAKVEGGFCEGADYATRRMETMRRLVAQHLQKFTDDFNARFFGNLSQYVGNMPKLTNGGAARLPGEALPLFNTPVAGASPSVNQYGFTRMNLDIRNSRAPRRNYAVGSHKVAAFAQGLAAQGIYRNDGYSPQAIAGGESPVNRLIVSDSIASKTGKAGALLIVPTGYIKVATIAINKPEYGGEGMWGDQTRTTIVDPVYGFEHDIVIDIEKCDELVSEVMTLTTRYAIITMPKCYNNIPALEDVNGIFLYDAECSDTSICDMGIEGWINDPAPLANTEVCADINADNCPRLCFVNIVGVAELQPNEYTLFANGQGGQGATSFTLQWFVNGVAAVGQTGVKYVAKAPLVAGDEVTVQITDNLGCTSLSQPFVFPA